MHVQCQKNCHSRSFETLLENRSNQKICATEGFLVQPFQEWDYGSYEPRSGRPLVVDDDVLLECVNHSPRQTTRNVSSIAIASNATVARHLETLGVHNFKPRSNLKDLIESLAQQQIDMSHID